MCLVEKQSEVVIPAEMGMCLEMHTTNISHIRLMQLAPLMP